MFAKSANSTVFENATNVYPRLTIDTHTNRKYNGNSTGEAKNIAPYVYCIVIPPFEDLSRQTELIILLYHKNMNKSRRFD